MHVRYVNVSVCVGPRLNVCRGAARLHCSHPDRRRIALRRAIMTFHARIIARGHVLFLRCRLCARTVMSRKASRSRMKPGVSRSGTTGFQRVLGGILVPAIHFDRGEMAVARAHGGVFEKYPPDHAQKMERICRGARQQPRRPDARMSCFQWAIEKNAVRISPPSSRSPRDLAADDADF